MSKGTSQYMDTMKPIYTFAQTYDCNAYGAGGFGDEQICTTTEQSSTQSSTGLAPTGESIVLGVGAGLALMVAAVIIIMRLRRKNQK